MLLTKTEGRETECEFVFNAFDIDIFDLNANELLRLRKSIDRILRSFEDD